MRFTLVVATCLTLALLAGPLRAFSASPQQVKDKGTLKFFASHPRLAKTAAGQLALLQIKVRQMDDRLRSIQDARRILTPMETEALVRATDPCLAEIIERESAGTWDPTIDFGGGHGNVYEAYGIGQANPGTKMEPFGSDWRTNPRTQLRWAVSYANARYGSTCGAWEHWQRNSWW